MALLRYQALRSLALANLLAIVCAAEAPAQATAADLASDEKVGAAEDQAPEPERAISASPENIDAQLSEGEAPPDSLFGAGPLGPVHDLWDAPTQWIRDEIGLALGLNYTALYQHATRARGTNDGVFGDLDLLGRWDLVDFDGRWPGKLAFRAESRHRMASDTPGQLTRRVGSLFSTSVSSNPQRFGVVELYWEQGSVEDGLIVRAGKVDPSLIYDAGRYVSQNTAFLGAAFSDQPAMAFPSAGLGVVAVLFPTESFYIGGGIHDAGARRTNVGFNSVEDADLFFAGEMGFDFRYGTEREGSYHITGWHSQKSDNRSQTAGQGFQVHADQKLGPGGMFVPFVRYGWADGGIQDTKQTLSAGLGIEQPFTRKRDLIGLAFAWSRPRRNPERDQYNLEVFYRVQVTPLISMTPDVQLILDPAKQKNRDQIWLFSLRIRTVF